MTPDSDYAIVLAIIKANQIPKDANKQKCLTRWQSQMVKELTRVVENAKTGMECEKVAEKVGEMGETLHGKVDKEVAAATGLGKMTTDHQRTDSISLVTPVSGP